MTPTRARRGGRDAEGRDPAPPPAGLACTAPECPLRRGPLPMVLGATLALGSCALGACDGEGAPPEPPAAEAAARPGGDEAPAPTPEPAEADLEAREAVFGRVELAPGFSPDPTTRRGSAGGPVDASELQEDCAGWISSRPSYLFDAGLTFAELSVMVAAEEDTSLVVLDPAGEIHCADDQEGHNPVVRARFAHGLYRVWVGAHERGARVRYALGFSELDDVTTADLR